MSNELKSYRLGDLPVRTTAASVRPFLPDIQEQLRRGVALATVVGALNERGIPVTASNLAKLLYRARKSGKVAPLASAKPTSASASASAAASTELSQTASNMPRGIDPEKWEQMSKRERDLAFADQYVNVRPRLFATKA